MTKLQSLSTSKSDAHKTKTCTIKTCPKCKVSKTVAQFSINKSRADGLFIYCKACASQHGKLYRRTENGFLQALWNNLRTCDAVAGRSGSTMTIEQLRILAAQPCYFSGAQTVKSVHSDNQLSIERLDNTKAHTFDNCVPCCLLFQNGHVQWTQNKVQQVKQQDADAMSTIDSSSLEKPKRVQKKLLPSLIRSHDAHESCRKCGNYHCDSFYIDNRSYGCKLCRSAYEKTRRDTVRGKLHQLVRDAKARSKQWKRKMCTLTLQCLVDKYLKQGGRCYYSNMPMTTKGDWKISLERLNTQSGYSAENTALVCVEFNATDTSAVDKDNIDGISRGWSRAKVDELIRSPIVEIDNIST